jgi:hypothetical protein
VINITEQSNRPYDSRHIVLSNIRITLVKSGTVLRFCRINLATHFIIWLR